MQGPIRVWKQDGLDIHQRELNNWIKSVLIQIFAKTSRSGLDLLNKWNEAKVGYDVGVDMTEDCRAVNGDSDHYHHQPHQKILSFSFPAKILCGDCFEGFSR